MTGKLILVEGVDGSGKSTLIEELRRRGIVDYIFNYSYPKEAETFQCGAFAKGEYFASIRIFKQLLARDHTIVCDRFHLGEYAYGVVKRNYPLWFAENIMSNTEELICKELGLKYVYLIVLFTNPITAFNRRKEFKKEYLEDKSEYYAVNDRYLLAFSKSILKKIGLQTCSLDYNNKPERILEVILRWINKEK